MADKKWALTTAGTAPAGYESTTYTDIGTWSAAEAADLSTGGDTYSLEAFDDWASGLAITARDEIRDDHTNGWTTDSTNRVVIRAADGEGHGGTIGGGFFIAPTVTEAIYIVRVDVKIEGIEFDLSSSTGNCVSVPVSGQNVTVDKCIFSSISGNNEQINPDYGYVVLNSLFIDGYRGVDVESTWTGDVINCTFDNFSSYAVLCRNFGSLINSVVTNSNGTSDPIFAEDASSDYIATDYTSVTGTNSITSITDTDNYNNLSGNDYSVKDTNADIYDAGNDLSATYPELAFDIAGNSRSSTYSIGAYEYVSGGAGEITVDSGSFALTGNAAALTVGRKLAADAQSYTLTGQDVALKRGFVALAEAGTITLTGHAAALIAARKITAAQASYTYTGNDAGLTYTPVGSYDLVADAGSYTLTGIAATLAVDRLIGAQTAAYTLTGVDAGLTYTPAGATTMTAEAAAFALTGQSSALLYARIMPATVQTYAATGQDVALRRGYSLALDAGAYSLSGLDVDWARTYQVAAGVGAYTLTGRNVTLDYSAAEVLDPGLVAHVIRSDRNARVVRADRHAYVIWR